MNSYENNQDNFVIVDNKIMNISDSMSSEENKIMPISGPVSSDQAWDQWKKCFSYEKHLSVSVYSGIAVILTTKFTDQMKEAISKVIPFSTGLGAGRNDSSACTTCRNRLSSLLCMRDFQGRPYFMPGEKFSYPVNFWPLWEASRSGEITHVRVVTPNQFGDYTLGGFKHFAVDTPTDVPEIGDIEARQRLLDKYVPIMTRLFTENGVKGIHDSLDTLIKVLPTVQYGGKLLESATWFRKHIREDFGSLSQIRKLDVLVKAIFDLKYCREITSNDVTLPLYHQLSKNTLDALAVCNSIEALRSLLEERLSPQNYQVKTNPAKEGNIDMALKLIGNFSVKLMTVRSAIEDFGAVKVKWDMYSASSAFGSMRSKKYSHKKYSRKSGAAGFAIRSKANVKNIRTMRDLMLNIPPNLEVNVTGKTPVFANEFVGLKEKVYQTPFTWGFKNGVNPSVFGLYGWCKVIAVLPMKSNFLFICEGAIVNKKQMGPCCHVGLLTPSYNRSCGRAFGNLKNYMELQFVESGPYAIGVGVSLDPKRLDDDKPPINGSITLRSGNAIFTIK